MTLELYLLFVLASAALVATPGPNVALVVGTSLRYGAGIGVRYYSSFGPVRVDVGTPLNPRRGDTPVAVYVSLGQAF